MAIKGIYKYVLLFLFMISGCTIDLTSKKYMNEALKYQSVPVVENFFNLTYVENHAIAFGIFGGIKRKYRMPLILILPLCVTAFCFFLFWKIRKAQFSILLPLFLILGGAYGNIIDRAMHGYVTDFLHAHYYYQYHFYVFNVADILVNIGLILLLLQYRQFNALLDGQTSSGSIQLQTHEGQEPPVSEVE